MNRARLYSAYRKLCFAALAVALLVSMIISPLLVHCTAADGQTTLELIGRDPHRHFHSQYYCQLSKSSPDSAFSSCSRDYEDCVDLLVNQAAILRIAPCHLLPASVWDAVGNLPVATDFRSFSISALRRDSVVPTSTHPQFKQPLLI